MRVQRASASPNLSSRWHGQHNRKRTFLKSHLARRPARSLAWTFDCSANPVSPWPHTGLIRSCLQLHYLWQNISFVVKTVFRLPTARNFPASVNVFILHSVSSKCARRIPLTRRCVSCHFLCPVARPTEEICRLCLCFVPVHSASFSKCCTLTVPGTLFFAHLVALAFDHPTPRCRSRSNTKSHAAHFHCENSAAKTRASFLLYDRNNSQIAEMCAHLSAESDFLPMHCPRSSAAQVDSRSSATPIRCSRAGRLKRILH